MIAIGNRVGRKKGFSWSSYWTPQSYVVENAAPSDVVLTYEKRVRASSIPDKKYFQISDHTVSSVSLDATGKILTIVLSAPVIYFDDLTLAISVGDDIYLFSITNNVLDDGNSVAYYDRTNAANVVAAAGVESIYWDLMTGSAQRGAEENSGTTVAYGVYEITATEADHFFTGCAVGNIFAAVGGVAIDANNKVKRVLGNHLSQPDSTAGIRPTNGVFPGLKDATHGSFLKTAPFTFNQPEFIYILFKNKTWTSTNFIFDGNTVNKGQLLQYDHTPEIDAYAGASLNNGNLPVNKWGIVRVKFNGLTSSLQVDKTAAVTGNAGTNNMGGFTLGASGGKRAMKLHSSLSSF